MHQTSRNSKAKNTNTRQKKSRLHIAISLFNQIRWQMHIFQGSFEWSKTCEVNRCRQRCWLLTIFIRPPHSRQTQTDKIQPTNATNTNLRPKDERYKCQKFMQFIFAARCCASAVLAMGLCLSVSLCLYVSVTSRSSTKTAKRRITQTTPYDSSGTLVFWCQRSPRNSTGVTPCTVAWQFARFQLTRRIARSLCDSWASCCHCA